MGMTESASAAPRITLQFHPDWPHGSAMVIESMARHGRYSSQFVTGISNGGLTAHPGGARWRWESRLFQGRYDRGPAAARPVYGAWNRRNDVYGGAVRFGSSYLRLTPDALSRSTFCYPDSVFEPTAVGGADLLPQLCDLADAQAQDELDDYVEAHVHGPVRFETDVEALVLDSSFAGTGVEAAARRLGCLVEFHPGFSAAPGAFDPDYRGADTVELARSLGTMLTPATLGQAARSGAYEPQALKRVWHCLARFGRRA